MNTVNFKPFVVEVTLSSPVIIDGYLTLDGLLGAAIFSRTNDVHATHNIPLKHSCGVYHGSQVFLESGDFETGSVPFVRKMGGSDVEPDAWIPNNPKAKAPYAFRIDKGDCCIRMGSRNFIRTSNAMWFGCGDIEKVKDLLSSITSIGAKRGQGFGQVATDDASGDLTWSVSEITDDLSLMLDDSPARPIPLNAWEGNWPTAFGSSQGDEKINSPVTGMASVTLPSWAGSPVLCVLPCERTRRLAALKKKCCVLD